MADSNIEELLKQILSAVFGKDVRQAIHDGIEQCYEDGKVGAVDLVARQRIDNLAKLPEGSTTGDAELQDIRIGYDGTEYENAGEAVRGQVSSLSEELDDLQESTNNIFDEKYVRDYYINPTNGIVGVNSENWGYSENFIPLSSEISSVTFSSPNVKETINIIIICYDSNKQYLSSFGVRSIDSIDNYFTVSFKQNSNTKYIRFNIQNVNDIVESNCNLMVEYGTVPTDYYPNKRIKNSTKIEVLEDKIDEIFKEFVIFGETYLEYGKKNDDIIRSLN